MEEPRTVEPDGAAPGVPERREFFQTASNLAMGASLVASYGLFAAHAGRFLYRERAQPRAWVFVTDVAGVSVGQSMSFRVPGGEKISITRHDFSGEASDFKALSSTCPHLGCQVHWQAQLRRFFCPCHNGVFDADGNATEGPPADAGQSLPSYPLKFELGHLYIEVPVTRRREA